MPELIKTCGDWRTGTATIYKREKGDYLIYLPAGISVSNIPEVRDSLKEAEDLIKSCGISLEYTPYQKRG